MITRNQLSMVDIFSDCQEILDLDKPRFLDLLENHIRLDEIVPASFRKHFYASTSRCRRYSLESLLWALILQRIFSIPIDSMLLTFLHYSHHLRQFCGFDKVPDASKITRFKQTFCEDLQVVFDRLVDITEPICQEIAPVLADMTLFDSTSMEAWVRENNPKYLHSMIRSLTAFAKAKGLNEHFEPQVKHPYMNGHFCYAYKAGMISNGLGVPRAIDFYDEAYFLSHPEIIREKSPILPMKTNP